MCIKPNFIKFQTILSVTVKRRLEIGFVIPAVFIAPTWKRPLAKGNEHDSS